VCDPEKLTKKVTETKCNNCTIYPPNNGYYTKWDLILQFMKSYYPVHKYIVCQGRYIKKFIDQNHTIVDCNIDLDCNEFFFSKVVDFMFGNPIDFISLDDST